MIRLNWFSRRTTNTATKTFRTTLSLNQLESREVPASLKSNFNPVAAAHANSNAAAHANAHAAIVSPVTTPTQTATIGGYVLVDSGAGPMVPSFATKVSLSVNGVEVDTVDVNPDGSYSFTVSLNQQANYTLQATKADGGSEFAADPLTVSLVPGQQLQGQNLLLLPVG